MAMTPPRQISDQYARRPFRLSSYLLAILAIGLAAGLRLLLQHISVWDAPVLSLVLAVLAVTVYRGLWPGLFAAVLGAFLWAQFYTHAIQINFFLLFLGGALVSVLGSLLISERWRAAAGESREQQQEKLIDLAHDAIIVRDPTGVILKWNAGATAVYGWTEDEAAGKVTHSLFDTKFPVSVGDMEAKLSEEGFWEGELRHTTRSGAGIIVASRHVLLRDAAGAPFRILEINREITSRKRAEARFLSLSDANVVGVACGTAAGGIVEANDAFLKMTGFSRDDLRAGAIVWPDTAGRSRAPFERDFLRKDGARIPVLIFAAAPEPPEEEAVVLMVDLSERKILEEKLQQKQKLETVGLLAAGVAHDFNNLLTSILMNSELALEKLPPGHDARRMMQAVTHEATRAAHLTAQLLAYAGKGGLSSKPIDLEAAIRQATLQTRDLISKQIPIRLDFDSRLSPINADQRQIQQLMTNLILNAAEAIGEKASGEIAVSTSRCELGVEDKRWIFELGEIHAGAYALVRVQDNGCGMDDATLARVFDPFFTTKFLGRGLGLSAAQGIARAHGGAIRIVSAPGQGATVEALFPLPPPESHLTQ
jgi:PAS domain S-box-containing protein